MHAYEAELTFICLTIRLARTKDQKKVVSYQL